MGRTKSKIKVGSCTDVNITEQQDYDQFISGSSRERQQDSSDEKKLLSFYHGHMAEWEDLRQSCMTSRAVAFPEILKPWEEKEKKEET